MESASLQGFFEIRDAVREQGIDQDHKAAFLRLLVFLDQTLAFIPCRPLCLIERAPTRLECISDGLIGAQCRCRRSSIEKTIGLPSRALRPFSHSVLARSIFSRQSGSYVRGRFTAGRASVAVISESAKPAGSSVPRTVGVGAMRKVDHKSREPASGPVAAPTRAFSP